MFSIHRTGTNYLGSVLKQWPTVSAFGELFHPRGVFGVKPAYLRAVSKAAGADFTDTMSPAFIDWARAHPLRLIEALGHVAQRQDRAALYFKVFLGQWTQPPEQVIAQFARLPGFTPVILQRRCVDVYVSFRKAEAAGKYKFVDTTAAPVELDARWYAHWADAARNWYRLVSGELSRAGTAPRFVTYERDIDMQASSLSAHWSRMLGIAAPPSIDPSLALARQDRNERLEDKIANHEPFLAALEERGLRDEALGYFVNPGQP